VKTLQDKPQLISAKPNSVAHLTTRLKPAPVDLRPVEKQHIWPRCCFGNTIRTASSPGNE
jgi:hypothetical protein